MSGPRASLVVFAALGLACGSGAKSYQPACRSNSDCKSGQVCFIDGCGDPGKNVVVEIIPSSTDQAYPQDFPLESLSAREDFQLAGPTVIQGNIRQSTLSDGGQPVPYSGSVSFTATGQSTLLPGLGRRFESNQVPLKGSYSLQVAEGSYSLIAYPADEQIPPLLQQQVTVSGAQSLPLDVVLAAPSQVVALSGQLVTSIPAATPLPAMAVQALTPQKLPLSQRVLLDGGTFQVNLAPPHSAQDAVLLVFTPRDSQAAVPQKSFMLTGGSTGPDGGIYVLGEYGLPMSVSGRLLDGAGQPVPDAVVHVEGTVVGGGTFQSPAVHTDTTGTFTLTTLASDPDAGFQLIAVPPPSSNAGLLEENVHVGPAGAPLGDLQCPTRVAISGSVTMPDGVTPASGVTVTAAPLARVTDGGAVPPQGAAATTNAQGNFVLALDPALYRFDFDIDVSLPTVSSFEVVDGTSPVMTLPPTALLKGRLVEGTVTLSAPASYASMTPAQALVRFYRRTEGMAGLPPTVLGQTYTDAQGHYRITIPTR